MWKHKDCGGTVLSGASGTPQAHTYCDRCGAYTHVDCDPLPTGTDKAANKEAWDRGDESSPDAR